MQTLSRTICVSSFLLLSACANQLPQTQLAPPPAPRQSNADMANDLQKAVERCLGMGLQMGSPLYEACVKRQLQ